MKLRNNFMLIAAATTGIVTLGTMTVASADATATPKTISRSVMHDDRTAAEAKILGISTDTLKADHKAHSIKQARVAKGLSVEQYRTQVQTELKQELTAQGYSTSQINQAMTRHEYKAHHKKAN